MGIAGGSRKRAMLHGAMSVPLHPAGPLGEATPALLALNNANAEALSLLTAARFSALLGRAFHVGLAEAAEGFILAFDQDAEYDSPNFAWFRQRYARFVYVDRVVVDPAARGRGLGRALYDGVIGRAVAAGHAVLACEVNLMPPNPGSDRFHAQLGFAEVGRAAVHGGARTVRYLVRGIGG